jgi:RNA polymerase sigma factor (sigma-70 family)
MPVYSDKLRSRPARLVDAMADVNDQAEHEEHAGGQWFEATHWSNVVAASQGESPRRNEALEKLCRTYWEPLYDFVRRMGYEVPEAQDATQSFFEHLLSGNRLQHVSPDKGKFRSFLLASLRNFLADQHDRANTAKRGSGQTTVPLDTELAEARLAQDPSPDCTAEHLFDRRWALVIVSQALDRLREEFAKAGKEQHFAELSVFLSREGNAEDYSAAARRLQLTDGAVPVAVHRLRLRYREAIRAGVANTVSSPAEVDGEMRYLLEVLCRG